MVERRHVAAEAPQAVQGAEFAEDGCQAGRGVRVPGQVLEPLQAVALNVGQGQGAAVVHLHTHTHTPIIYTLNQGVKEI